MASVNKVILERLYLSERKSIPDIAEMLGIGYSAARQQLLDSGVPLRTRADGIRAASHKLGKHMLGKSIEFSQQWKNNIRASRRKRADETASGLSAKTRGYIEITRGEHKGRGEHVVLMERSIGRPLSANEVVHHIDENKHNNSIENLMLMTRAAHTALHRKQRKVASNGIS